MKLIGVMKIIWPEDKYRNEVHPHKRNDIVAITMSFL